MFGDQQKMRGRESICIRLISFQIHVFRTHENQTHGLGIVIVLQKRQLSNWIIFD